jgi:hypothetical protein
MNLAYVPLDAARVSSNSAARFGLFPNQVHEVEQRLVFMAFDQPACFRSGVAPDSSGSALFAGMQQHNLLWYLTTDGKGV